MAGLGCNGAALRKRVFSIEVDAERALMASFRRLSVERQEAVLRIIGAIEVPAATEVGAKGQADANDSKS